MTKHLLTFFALFTTMAVYCQCELVVEVTNIRTEKGILQVCVFKAESNYLGKADACNSREISSKDNQTIKLDLPCGEYAVAIYHDVNNNGRLDKNFVGIPNEPYGFPGNPSTLFGPPSFEKALVDITTSKIILIKL